MIKKFPSVHDQAGIFNTQYSILNFQLSTFNFQFSTNYSLFVYLVNIGSGLKGCLNKFPAIFFIKKI